MNRLIFTSDSSALDTSAGQLGGLTTSRDTAIPNLISKLDALASGLITSINAVHAAGYGLDGSTGLDFFTGTNAGDIGVNAALLANPQQFAASSVSGSLGNAQNALALADLQLTDTMSGSTLTFDEFYTSLVTVLGADSRAAIDAADTADLVLGHIETQRQSVSGVNIDEEVANMTMAQHAYNAAARVITTIDEMLDTLINRTAV
jgi:flagellar hook-associated protein 1 FlgK